MVEEIPQITIDGMGAIVEHQVIGLDQVAFFLSTFGIGKTTIMKQEVARLNQPGALEALLGDKIWFQPRDGGPKRKYKGVKLCDFRVGGYQAVDIRGTPWPDKVDCLTTWFPPATLPFIGNPRFEEDYIILVFFDEYNMAEEDVFGMLYQLTSDRAAGEHKFGPNVRICLAGNLSTDHGVVHETPMPLSNRGSTYNVIMDVAGWCDWAFGNGIAPEIVAFFKQPVNHGLLHNYDPKSPTPIVSTPRTVEKMNAIYLSDMPDDLKMIAMKATVGTGVVAQFMGFLTVWKRVPSIKKIMADPMGIELPEELSMMYATVVKVANSLDLQTMAPLYKFLTRLDGMYVVLAITMANARNPIIRDTPEYARDYVKRYRDVYSRT